MAEVKVLFSYEAEQDDELSLNIGDIIKNVVMSEGGWWEGEINGQKGLFPDNFVEVISTGENNEDKENTNNEIKNNKISMKKGHIAEMANKIKEGIQVGAMKSNKKAFSKKKLAKVCFDYTPDAEDELELHTGDVLEVLREVEVGWWEGRLNGKTGLFPSNFVECCENPDDEEKEKSVKTDEPEKKDISTDPETKGKKIRGVGFGNIFERGPIKLRPSTGGWKPEADDAKGEKSPPGNISTPVKKNRPCPEKAVARFSYHAENEDELSLKEGDIITVIEKELEDVGWWKGEINGRIGVFPDNFVELIPLQEELPKQKTGSSQSNSSGMRSTRSNSESSKSDNKHSSSSSSSNMSMSGSGSKDTGVLNTGIHGGLRKGRDSNDLSDKSALPALSSKKPYPPPPPIGKKPIPTKPDIIRQSTIDNRELSRSSSSPKGSTSNLSENKSRDKESHREKDKDDKAYPDFDNLDLPPSEKLVHLTANRVKQPNKRPPSQVFLHTEEEKNELKESKEKETFRGEKKSAALTAVSMKEEKKSAKDDRKSLSMPTTPPPPPGIHSSKNYKKEENKEEAKRPVGYLSSSSSSVSSVADPQKLRSPSLGKKSDLATQSDVGLRSDDLKELLAEIKEMKANMVTRSSFEDLQAENERLRQDLESVKTTLHRKVRNIIDELDEEKKVRLNMQVEIDRMKKLVSESTI